MPDTHEFGILDECDQRKAYNDYEPHKYDCISVADDLIRDLLPELTKMKTYFHAFDRPAYGLAYCGVTLIPTESLPLFYEVVASSPKSRELRELTAKILQAKAENRCMIHYGL